MEHRVVEMVLPNGVTALVRAVDANGVGTGATKTSALGKLDFDEVGGILTGLSEAVKSSVDKVTPDKVSVEFGLQMAMKSGRLTGLLVDGQGSGSLKVTLEWARAAPVA